MRHAGRSRGCSRAKQRIEHPDVYAARRILAHAPNPSQPKDQRPRGRPPRPGAASSPRRARPQGAPCQAAPMLAFEANQAPGPGLQPRPPRATDRKTRGRPASDPGTAARAESEPTERSAAPLSATATRRSLQPPPRSPAERLCSGGPPLIEGRLVSSPLRLRHEQRRCCQGPR